MKEITPYLMFNGNCRDAMTFYQKTFGGELTITTYGETEPKTAPEHKNEVIHGMLVNGATVIMASDTMPGERINPGNDVWLTLACDNPAEVDTVYAVLVAQGTPNQPPHDAFWGDRFAMVTDRFGVRWMLDAKL